MHALAYKQIVGEPIGVRAKKADIGVTFNVGIFQEGGLGPETIDQLAELASRSALRPSCSAT